MAPPWKWFAPLVGIISIAPALAAPYSEETTPGVHGERPRHLSERELCEEVKTVQFLDIGEVDCDELDGENNEKVELDFFDETTEPAKLTNRSMTNRGSRRSAGSFPTTSPGSSARF